MDVMIEEVGDFTEITRELGLIPNNENDTVHVYDLTIPDKDDNDGENMFPECFNKYVLSLGDMKSLDDISPDFPLQDRKELEIYSLVFSPSGEALEGRLDEETIISDIFEVECSQKALEEEEEKKGNKEEQEQEQEQEQEDKDFSRNIWDVISQINM